MTMALPEGRPSPVVQMTVIKDLSKAPLQLGDKWNLICAKWWQKWERFVGYMEAEASEVVFMGDTANSEDPGMIVNSHLVLAEVQVPNGEEHKLRNNLQETVDYEVVHAAVWNKLFEWYGGGPKISREVISRGHLGKDLIVEVYPLVLVGVRSTVPEATREISISQMATIGELKKRLCDEFQINTNDCQLWDYYKGSRYVKLEKMEDTLDSAKLLPCQKVMVEEKVDGKYPDAAEQVATTSGPYSSQDDVMLDADGASRKGRAGLNNLGNTCFMNSALQCLSHTPPLSEYFLSDKYLTEINPGNPLGLGGDLANSFGQLMHQLWSGTEASVVPKIFKSRLGKFAPQFSGYNQQDTQELLAFLLDGLHEDLNRVKQKPYIESKDSNNRPDDEVADEAWSYHLQRNNSKIVELFQGQYKSTLVCPVCACKSVTFDPFMYLSLPLPATSRTIKITFVTADGTALPATYGLKVPKAAKVSEVLAVLAEKVNLKESERLVLTEVFHSYIYRTISATSPVSTLKDGEDLYAYRLPKSIGGETNLKDVVLMHQRVDTRSAEAIPSGPTAKPLMVSIPAKLAGGGVKAAAALEAALEAVMRPFLRVASHMAHVTAPSEAGAAANGQAEEEAMEVGEQPLYELRHTNVACRAAGSMYSELPDGKAGVGHVGGVYSSGGGGAEHVGILWAPRTLEEKYDLTALETPLVDPSCEPSKDGGVTLDHCIEGFLQEEPLGPDDMWYCPTCKEHRQATKKLELWRVPEVLVVHLKRFSYSRVWRDKLDTYVSYPVNDLDLSKYVKQKQAGDDAKPAYDLFAVDNHYGGLGGGHYTAYAKHKEDSNWYLFDDSTVTQVDESKVVGDAASGYVLFYLRKDKAQSTFAETMET